jgi:DNA-binding response OmpR family regulator
MLKPRILLVEDDKSLARLLCDNLAHEGFEFDWSVTGADAIRMAKQHRPDLAILDVMLPHSINGFALCERLASDQIPVIMLTARGEKEDRVRGLTVGADDYVVKPFSIDELTARIKAVLRRSKPKCDRIAFRDLSIDFRRLEVTKRGQTVRLTDREFEVLRTLALRAGKIVSRDELLELVFGYSSGATTRTLDNVISRLRAKLEDDPHHPDLIRTAYGDGYRLATDDEDPHG